MDAQLKLLSEHYAALQVAFIRGAAALPFVLLPILLRGNLRRLRAGQCPPASRARRAVGA